MRKIIIPFLFVCSMSFGQMFSAQNAESGITDTNTYVIIGTQTWMKYNLKVTNYNNGTGIQKITDSATWVNATTPAYCWYNNDSVTYAATYGALYNWYAVNTENICPINTHVPSNVEIDTLNTYLGGVSVAGGHLKEVGTTHWQTPNEGADNSSSFTSRPGGNRNTGHYQNLFQYSYYWDANEMNATSAYCFWLYYNDDNSHPDAALKYQGFSVRCIKD